ncbi:MAG TPA: hypothetical protein VFN67_11590 [Polyangiales bacterium]|nr:hypothetical protein [Polyangiales bacterium]
MQSPNDAAGALLIAELVYDAGEFGAHGLEPMCLSRPKLELLYLDLESSEALAQLSTGDTPEQLGERL